MNENVQTPPAVLPTEGGMPDEEPLVIISHGRTMDTELITRNSFDALIGNQEIVMPQVYSGGVVHLNFSDNG